MKFAQNPGPSPNVNPGIKNDRGRIILILIVAAIGYFVYTSWAGWEQGAGEIWDEIVAEVESELDINLSGDEDSTMEDASAPYEPYEAPVYEFEPEPLPNPVPREPSSPFELSTSSSTTIETDLSNDMAREIMLESRQQIIDQLRAQGQEDQIPMVLEMLDEMEQSYYE